MADPRPASDPSSPAPVPDPDLENLRRRAAALDLDNDLGEYAVGAAILIDDLLSTLAVASLRVQALEQDLAEAWKDRDYYSLVTEQNLALEAQLAVGEARDRALRQLVEQWRADSLRLNTVHATMGSGWRVCADELDAALRGSTASSNEVI